MTHSPSSSNLEHLASANNSIRLECFFFPELRVGGERVPAWLRTKLWLRLLLGLQPLPLPRASEAVFLTELLGDPLTTAAGSLKRAHLPADCIHCPLAHHAACQTTLSCHFLCWRNCSGWRIPWSFLFPTVVSFHPPLPGQGTGGPWGLGQAFVVRKAPQRILVQMEGWHPWSRKLCGSPFQAGASWTTSLQLPPGLWQIPFFQWCPLFSSCLGPAQSNPLPYNPACRRDSPLWAWWSEMPTGTYSLGCEGFV